ncbi:MAG TPA: glutaminase A [Arachnia sp.]|nr:glutaminase A [Arachnia sp.]HMT86946.1 glutaminase A [Arachnia sp.]
MNSPGPVDSTTDPVSLAFATVIDQVRAQRLDGKVADYIPELAKADPDEFAIAATSVAGHIYEAGDSGSRFTIQSISKAFVYALALRTCGIEAVRRRVGVEPSGEAFNAISFDDQQRPANPLINAGAVVTTSLIPATTGEERFERIRAGLSEFAGRQLEADERVAASESSTGDRNRALAMLARSYGMLGSTATTVDEVVEPYFRQCALLIDCTDLAVMGATLANHGENPITGRQVVSPTIARQVLSLMSSCGMYDRSGQWLFEVGMPAKSGVGGGIVAVAPGEYGIGVYSPPLDAVGNSSRGVTALRTLAEEFGLHLFNHPDRPTSPIARLETADDGDRITLRLRGTIDFIAAEQVAYTAAEALADAGSTTLLLDLVDVTAVTTVAARLIRDLCTQAGTARRWRVVVRDPAGLLSS